MNADSYYLRSSAMIIQIKKYFLLTSVMLLLVSAPPVSAQTEPAHKLVEFHMALLKHGPKWTTVGDAATTPLHEEHVKYVMSLVDAGKAVIAGPAKVDDVFKRRSCTSTMLTAPVTVYSQLTLGSD